MGQRTFGPVDPAIWQRADMRAALAGRDIAAVFKILQRNGVSQRRIAALTGQSQSEVSEILSGRRVVSYEVLVRIAEGLGVSRGTLGLAYDEETASLIGLQADSEVTLMARLTELALGMGGEARGWAQPFPVSWGPGPDHVGIADVRRLESITDQMSALDHEFGGGSCRDAVLAQVGWAQQLLRARVSDEAVKPLHIAVADLHLVAGWTSFDMGLIGPARQHFGRALEHARFAVEPSLVAKSLYCLGRLHLHHNWLPEAVRLFQLGQLAAQESGQARAVAMLQANLAWAHAVAGDSRQAVAGIDLARGSFGQVAPDEATPRWVRFFDSAELAALRGMTLACLPDPTAEQRAAAIDRLEVSSTLRELPMTRSRAFELTALAWLVIDGGDLDYGVNLGNEAAGLAANLRSQRVIDRMAPLRASLARRAESGDARDLSERIAILSGDEVPVGVA